LSPALYGHPDADQPTESVPCAQKVAGTEASGVETPFPIEPELNSKVYIWEGKLWKLRADAILNSTNESMTERQGLAGQILTQVLTRAALKVPGQMLNETLFHRRPGRSWRMSCTRRRVAARANAA